MSQRTFSAATYKSPLNATAVRSISNALSFLLSNMNSDGTWGVKSALDKLISTTHVAMAFQIFGVPPESRLLTRAFEFLANIDTDKHVSFYYRAAPLLNLKRYETTIQHDLEYMWEYRRRVAVHKDYPIPFFLLKMMQFRESSSSLSFSKQQVLRWILEDWNHSECWYGRTSITSMALPLIYDIKFVDKHKITTRCVAYIKSKFGKQEKGRPGWSNNSVDDAFTVFNLCDRRFLRKLNDTTLIKQVHAVADDLSIRLDRRTTLTSEPPFGGDVGETVYPTAVCIRAISSFQSLYDDEFLSSVCGALVGSIEGLGRAGASTGKLLNSFWGAVDVPTKKRTCFVLMPFEPSLSDIYREHVKKPIESKLKYKVFRADDIFKSTKIMEDIWRAICTAEFVIADLTGKNPNVFYEAGLCHAIGKQPILISQRADDIPFDLRGVRTIIYNTTPTGYRDLSKQLLTYLGKSSA